MRAATVLTLVSTSLKHTNGEIFIGSFACYIQCARVNKHFNDPLTRIVCLDNVTSVLDWFRRVYRFGN